MQGGGLRAPAVIKRPDGDLQLFALDGQGNLQTVTQTVGAWANPPVWTSLGGTVVTRPAIGINYDGTLAVYAGGKNGAIYHKRELGRGNWSDWTSLEGRSRMDEDGGRWPLVVGTNNDKRLEIFIIGENGAVFHNWQLAPKGDYSGWKTLDGYLSSNPSVGQNLDGRLEIFATGDDGGMFHKWQTFPLGPGCKWTDWVSLKGILTSAPAVGSNRDGRLEAFAFGQNSGLWDIWQIAANGNWSDWFSLNGTFIDGPAVGINDDGRLEVFAIGQDGRLYHIWQLEGGGWSAWDTLPYHSNAERRHPNAAMHHR